MGPVFTCSIDDGHPLDARTAELLDKHGLHGTFYLPIRNCEGDSVMAAPAMRELAQRFEIGSHTRDHCYLKNVDAWQAYEQIADGKRQLEDVLGEEVAGFCYPGGRYRRRDVELVRSCGFLYARTTMNLCFDAGMLPFEMPTTIQFYPHGRSVYLRNFVASRSRLHRIGGLQLALAQEDWVARLYAMFDHACARNSVFHLWAHSLQIETLGAWDTLDAFLSHVAANVPVHHRLTNGELARRSFVVPQTSAVELF